MYLRTLAAVLAASVVLAVPGVAAAEPSVNLVADPQALVNPMIGTKGEGFTSPGPMWPFGMVQWSPDSSPRQPGGATTTTRPRSPASA